MSETAGDTKEMGRYPLDRVYAVERLRDEVGKACSQCWRWLIYSGRSRNSELLSSACHCLVIPLVNFRRASRCKPSVRPRGAQLPSQPLLGTHVWLLSIRLLRVVPPGCDPYVFETRDVSKTDQPQTFQSSNPNVRGLER